MAAVEVTQSDIDNGFSVTIDVTVTENGGVYSGRKADWSIICLFSK